MVTLEARAYGVARHLRQEAGRTDTAPGGERRRQAGGRWMIVNDVAGFIGPEVFTAPDQLERACLEDRGARPGRVKPNDRTGTSTGRSG